MNHRVGKLILIGFLLLAVPGCGKKDAPRYPGTEIPDRVTELRVEMEGGIVVLHGKVATPRGADQTRVAGIRLYHTRYPIGAPPCEGCPIDFPDYEEIDGQFVREGRFRYPVTHTPREGVHFFRVHLTGPGNGLGPASRIAKLTVGS